MIVNIAKNSKQITNNHPFIILFLIVPNNINIGKATKTYLGMLESVPERVGVIITSHE